MEVERSIRWPACTDEQVQDAEGETESGDYSDRCGEVGQRLVSRQVPAGIENSG